MGGEDSVRRVRRVDDVARALLDQSRPARDQRFMRSDPRPEALPMTPDVPRHPLPWVYTAAGLALALAEDCTHRRISWVGPLLGVVGTLAAYAAGYVAPSWIAALAVVGGIGVLYGCRVGAGDIAMLVPM